VYAVTVRMCCAASGGAISVDETRRLVREAAGSGDGLQHIYVQATRCGADVVVFLLADGLAAAERTAAGLIERARQAGLVGCEPTTCEVELIVPFAEAALPRDPAP
jgi:hypothetical protein